MGPGRPPAANGQVRTPVATDGHPLQGTQEELGAGTRRLTADQARGYSPFNHVTERSECHQRGTTPPASPPPCWKQPRNWSMVMAGLVQDHADSQMGIYLRTAPDSGVRDSHFIAGEGRHVDPCI